MSVRMRHTRAQTRERRSHHALTAVAVSICTECKARMVPHRVCLSCGKYRGRTVIDLLKKVAKKENKRKEKARAASGAPVEKKVKKAKAKKSE